MKEFIYQFSIFLNLNIYSFIYHFISNWLNKSFTKSFKNVSKNTSICCVMYVPQFIILSLEKNLHTTLNHTFITKFYNWILSWWTTYTQKMISYVQKSLSIVKSTYIRSTYMMYNTKHNLKVMSPEKLKGERYMMCSCFNLALQGLHDSQYTFKEHFRL